MAEQPIISTVPAPAAYAETFVDIEGLRLRVQDYGAAGKPPMLCVHGGAANAHWFDFVAQGFTADYHVRAIDLRGHGDSEWDNNADPPDYQFTRHAADIHALTGKLDLRDFILIGHSMGGMVSLTYASTYPGRARALVVVDSNLVMTPERIAGFHAVGNRPGRTYDNQEAFISNFRVRPGGSTAPAEILRHIASHSGRRFEDGLWRHKADRRVYMNRQLFDSLDLWNSIKIPTLLMKGGRSSRMAPEAIAVVQSRAPQTKLTVVPDAEHHITLDNPAGFIHAAQDFLAGIS